MNGLDLISNFHPVLHSSVASSLVIGGGGGGARLPNVPTKRKSCTCNLYARASEASERLRNIYIFRSPNTSVYIYNQCRSHLLLVVWRYKIQAYRQNTNIEKKSMNMRASGVSELRQILHFHILKLLFPSIFCWYFRYFVSETYYFQVSK